MNSCILFLSGGLDSVVALKLLLDSGYMVYPVFIDYGQKALKNERKAVDFFCQYYNLPPLKVISAHEYDSFLGHPLLGNLSNDSTSAPFATQSKNYLPFRNLLFSCIGGILASQIGVHEIAFGFTQKENYTYFPDTSPRFIEEMNVLFNLIQPESKYKIISPTVGHTKPQLVRLAIEKKIPIEHSYSCYDEEVCNKCESCLELKKAGFSVSTEV